MTDTVLTLRRAWSDLGTVAPTDLVGDWEASFVRPLTRIAPPGLGLLGLPNWYGKRFRAVEGEVSGVNLLRADGDDALRETMPMSLSVQPSLVDGTPTLTVSYAPGTRKPWPWVRDEFRPRGEGILVGMTVVDLPGMRAVGGTPFLLTRR